MENTTTKEESHKIEKAWMKETGKLDFTLTNDYMFRALLQKNVKVLKALICSLLHLDNTQDLTVEITNPIKLGESMNDKTFILDVSVLLNGNTIVNLEMQVVDEEDWPERSLSYLCREFDNLEKGEEYTEVMPAVQIGILNFDLFEDAKEFYSTNYMMNVKNQKIYSDKFCIHVLSLNQIHLATEEDKAYGIDYWARLFKATTWKELKEMAAQNPITEDAAETMYEIYKDKIIRDQMFARQEYNMRERRNKRIRAEYSEALKVIDAQKAEIDEQKAEIDEQKAENAKLLYEIQRLKAQLEHK